MPLIRSSVNNLIGGVSQQPPAVRGGDRCEAMVNAWPSPVDGLTKRQPTQLVKNIGAVGIAAWKYHFISRSASERYLVIVKSGAIEVYDVLTGDSKVVVDVTAGGFNYISGATKDDLELVTVADHTFILNKTKTVAMDGTLSAAPANASEAYCVVRHGNYATKYGITLKIGASTFTYSISTWGGTTAIAGSFATAQMPNTELNSIHTDVIAEQLKLGLNSVLVAAGVTTVALTRRGAGGNIGSILRISDPALVFDSAESIDSVGDSVMSVIYKSVTRVAGFLPEFCTGGYRLKVVGDAEIDADDYYVKFVADAGGTVFGKGIWEESISNSAEYRLTRSTMPHKLTRRFAAGDVEFDYDVVAWDDKETGDTLSNPRPSFVGKTLNDIFFFKQRLGVLADDRVVMSETGEPFNWWRTTLLTLPDTDLIDLTINHHPVALVKQAVPFDDGLFIKSGNAQFILRGGDILSPRTVQINAVTAFESFSERRPIPVGRTLFFGFKRGNQSGLREFFNTGNEGEYDAADVTQLVPNYIQGEVTDIAASTLEETLAVLATGSASRLYLYKFLWSGNQKMLSSWGTWEFNTAGAVKAISFIDNSLYVVMYYAASGGLFLEKVEIATGLTDSGSSYTTLLDRRIDETVLSPAPFYDSLNDRTLLTLPYLMPIAELACVQKLTGIQYQILAPLASDPPPGTVIAIRGNVTAANFWVGVPYTMTYEFSAPILKEAVGGSTGKLPSTGAVQKVKKLALEFHDSGLFHATVKIGSRDEYTYEIAGPQPSFATATINQVVLRTGSESIPIMGRAEEAVVKIKNSGPYPSNITSAQWTMLVNERGVRS